MEPVCAALELDPFTSGVQIIDATDLAALRSDEVAGKVIPTVPLLVAHIYHRTLASDVKLALGECYPDVWPVKLVSSIDRTGSETVVEMPLYEIDHTNFANQFNTLYVPPLAALDALRVPETLRYITMRLRRDPDGCPWDREQTHQSLTRYVIEETYEVVEALEENDLEKLAEELGDLLLQVYLHAEIARQDGDFNIGDVFEHVSAKLIRRHPHVFGQIEVENAGQVVQNWEEIKRQERIAAGKDVESESILDGVPLASPALIVAQKYQKRAAKVGFDYDNLQQVLAKLTEELQELQEATTPEHRREEMGDVLFMVARIARELDIDAEEALRYANRKFRQRFQEMEHITRQEGRTFSSYSLDEWLNLWNRVKAKCRDGACPHPGIPSYTLDEWLNLWNRVKGQMWRGADVGWWGRLRCPGASRSECGVFCVSVRRLRCPDALTSSWYSAIILCSSFYPFKHYIIPSHSCLGSRAINSMIASYGSCPSKSTWLS